MCISQESKEVLTESGSKVKGRGSRKEMPARILGSGRNACGEMETRFRDIGAGAPILIFGDNKIIHITLS